MPICSFVHGVNRNALVQCEMFSATASHVSTTDKQQCYYVAFFLRTPRLESDRRPLVKTYAILTLF